MKVCAWIEKREKELAGNAAGFGDREMGEGERKRDRERNWHSNAGVGQLSPLTYPLDQNVSGRVV